MNHTVANEIIAEGKTKIVMAMPGIPESVHVLSKVDITAGDGAKHDSFANKDVWATATNCAVFDLLRSAGLPVAYEGRLASNAFQARRCRMLPYEIVIRRLASGSFLKRNPGTKNLARLETLVVEFFLKTTGKRFGEIEVPKDDPYIVCFDHEGAIVCRPDMPPDDESNPKVTIPRDALYGPLYGEFSLHPFHEMEMLARKVFLLLEKAWGLQGCTLIDLKIECGLDVDGRLLVADVIDNDSWRLLDEGGSHLDKQRYRDGAALEAVAALYHQVADRVVQFRRLLNVPQIVLWCASEKDKADPFFEALKLLGDPAKMHQYVQSVHKQPEAALQAFRAFVSKKLDTVVIAYVGRSNGVGPVLQGDSHVPVIAVPASWKEFPEDVWSSLRMPSDVPLLTCLDPANAIQAAVGILAAKSPHCYMARRFCVESFKLDAQNSPTFKKTS